MGIMRNKWTIDSLKQEAFKYDTLSTFNCQSKGAYLSAYRKGILQEITSHMESSKTSSWTESEIAEEALKYETRWEFQSGSKGAYLAAYRNDILDQVCLHMKEGKHMWTKEELIEEALKYVSRVEFQCENSGAYQSARNKGIMEEICSHMGPSKSIPYTFEEMALEASKYNHRSVFQKNSPAYQAAQARGILNQICSHMEFLGGTSLCEIELFDSIKIFYPNAKKLRDKKVKIEGKPYIHGFEIDILVGNLGIEFDGAYHHSFEFMRKQSRRTEWSNDDIRNYHELKDSWFATKGIQILHIKETDWNIDKEACIQKCLEFLGT